MIGEGNGVEVIGDREEIRYLMARVSSPSLYLKEYEGRHYVFSEKFNNLGGLDIIDVASDLVRVINGYMLLIDPSFEKIKVSNSSIELKSGNVKTKRVHVEPVQLIAKVPRVSVRIGTERLEPVSPKADFRLFTEDQQRALKYFSEPIWSNLYKVYELVRESLGGEANIINKGWTSKRELSLFRHTAQSYEAIGDEARHSTTRSEPPKQPMSRREARGLMRKLLSGWLGVDI